MTKWVALKATIKSEAKQIRKFSKGKFISAQKVKLVYRFITEWFMGHFKSLLSRKGSFTLKDMRLKTQTFDPRTSGSSALHVWIIAGISSAQRQLNTESRWRPFLTALIKEVKWGQLSCRKRRPNNKNSALKKRKGPPGKLTGREKVAHATGVMAAFGAHVQIPKSELWELEFFVCLFVLFCQCRLYTWVHFWELYTTMYKF